MLHTKIIEPKQLEKWACGPKVSGLNPQSADKVQACK